MGKLARRVRGSAVALVGLFASVVSLPAHAVATFQVRSVTSATAVDGVSDNQNPPESDTGPVPIGPLPDTLADNQSSSAAAGSASASGIASGQASLTAPGSFTGAELRSVSIMQALAPAGGPNPTSASGVARSIVHYQDELVVSGRPFFTPVRLRVTLELDGAMARVGEPTDNLAELTFFDQGMPDAPIDSLSCSKLTGPCSLSDTGEIEVLAGVPYDVQIALLTLVTGQANPLGSTFASSSSDVGGGGRAHFCIDVLVPGTSYTLESGGDLRCAPDPPPVPVLPPLAVGLLAGALVLAVRRALRRVRS